MILNAAETSIIKHTQWSEHNHLQKMQTLQKTVFVKFLFFFSRKNKPKVVIDKWYGQSVLMNSVQLNFICLSLKGKLVLQQEKAQIQNNKQDVEG